MMKPETRTLTSSIERGLPCSSTGTEDSCLVTGRAQHARRGGYVWERVWMPCTRLQEGDLTIWTRINDRRPGMTEASCSARLGASRGCVGMMVLEVTCSDAGRLSEAVATVRRMARPGTIVTTNPNRWTPRVALRMPWRTVSA